MPVGWPYAISLPYQSKALIITVSPVDLFLQVCSSSIAKECSWTELLVTHLTC